MVGKNAKSKSQEPPAFSPSAAAQPRRSRGRGVAPWPVFPSLVRPRPFARALGASEERARARRAAGSPETLGHGCPVRHGCPVWPFAKSGRVAGSGFLVRWRIWLGCSFGLPIRLRHAIFPAPVWLRASMVYPARGVPAWRGASRCSPAAASGHRVIRLPTQIQPVFCGSVPPDYAGGGSIRATGFCRAGPLPNLGQWSFRG